MKFVDQLRKNRENPSNFFMMFLQKLKKNTAHVFVEGADDASFYRNFILRFFNSSNDLHFHNCGGKEIVYNVQATIKARSDLPKQVYIIYCVDKDLSDYLFEDYPIATDIFVTDYYSIENYLVSDEMVRFILTDSFNFYDGESWDIEEIQIQFREQLDRFHKLIQPIMICIIFHKKQKMDFDLDKLSLSTIFDVTDDLEITIKSHIEPNGLLLELHRRFSISTEITQYLNEASVIANQLLDAHPKTYIRGKYEIWFLNQFMKKTAKLLKNSKVKYTELNTVKMLAPRLHSIPSALENFLKLNFQRSNSISISLTPPNEDEVR